MTYWHLRLLVRRMRSFRRVSYRPGPFGPAGGLVTFSRRPVSGTAFRRFGRPPRVPGVTRASRFQASLKGALVTRLARPELCVINTHPVANHDGDWSMANRYYPLHRAQFAVLAHVVNEAGPRAVVCGDFNIARESSLFDEFTAATGLADAFEGACPPTFRAEYLPAGATPHCIDFILTAGEVKAESAALVFAERRSRSATSRTTSGCAPGCPLHLTHQGDGTEPLAGREVEGAHGDGASAGADHLALQNAGRQCLRPAAAERVRLDQLANSRQVPGRRT